MTGRDDSAIKKPYRIILVEDEPPARRRLTRLLEESGIVESIVEADTVRDAVTKINKHKPDVVFLDVRIPGGDGFSVLQKLEEIPPVIFVTAYDDFAVEAFDRDAVDYLVKPVSADRLQQAIERLERRLSKGGVQEQIAQLVAGPGMPARIVARRRGKIVMLDPQSVTHLTADHTLVFAWREGESFLVPRTLQEMEDELEPQQFRRTHRSALVNLAHVSSVRPAESGNFILQVPGEGDEMIDVPLSRRRARVLRKEMGF